MLPCKVVLWVVMERNIINIISSFMLSKLMKKEPVSSVFGFDRGDPIDRYYIEKFLSENSMHIKGRVMEIAENTYTRKYGGEKVEKSLIMSADKSAANADIIGDLATGEGISEDIADCFIMTQTLPFIFDLHSCVKNSVKILKPGGVLLVTVPGITQISRYDMQRWGHYWSFTDLSLRKLYETVVPPECIEIQTFGNAKAAACFLYGLAQKEISRKVLDYFNPDYQVLITAVVRKP